MKIGYRQATVNDVAAIADLFLRSRKTLLPYAPLAHSDDAVKRWVRERLVITADIHLAIQNKEIVGYIALIQEHKANWIDHLYLHPTYVGKGIGTALMQIAKAKLTPPIHLYCFQQNMDARRFYERHGFVAIEFGDGSGNEENCPDVLYQLV